MPKFKLLHSFCSFLHIKFHEPDLYLGFTAFIYTEWSDDQQRKFHYTGYLLKRINPQSASGPGTIDQKTELLPPPFWFLPLNNLTSPMSRTMFYKCSSHVRKDAINDIQAASVAWSFFPLIPFPNMKNKEIINVNNTCHQLQIIPSHCKGHCLWKHKFSTLHFYFLN